MTLETKGQRALDHIKAFLEPHAADFADKLARELAGEGDAALEAVCGTLHAELGRQLPKSVAFGLAAGFAALMRDKMAATKH
jgi:hypothetical protein